MGLVMEEGESSKGRKMRKEEEGIFLGRALSFVLEGQLRLRYTGKKLAASVEI